MDEMFKHIFGSLYSSEKAISNIEKSLKRQRNFNKNVVGFAAVVVTYVIATELYKKIQDREIEALKKEIEELKAEKGE